MRSAAVLSGLALVALLGCHGPGQAEPHAASERPSAVVPTREAPVPVGSAEAVQGPLPGPSSAEAPASTAPASTTAPTPAPAGTPASGAKGPTNVLFLTIDSMRADMPWQGYPRDIAPNLTALAKESTVYTRAYAISSYTSKSVSGFLSGRYPSQLYRSGVFFAEYNKSNEFFPELLQSAGVRTLGGHAHFYFDAGRGKHLDQGFDVWRLIPGIKVNNSTDESITGDKLTDLGIEMLSDPKNTGGPFFLWLHYMDPHDQYLKHPEVPKFGKDARAHYDGEIFYTDLQVERLLAYARKQPWWENTAIIVSADHGEAFGEHDVYRHAFALWEVLTRVPLIVKLPGATPKRIDARRSAVDIAPTIVELLGAKPGEGFVGKSLVGEVLGSEAPANREPIVLDLPEDTNNPHVRAIVHGKYKLTVDGEGAGYSLYDLDADPGENKNLVKSKAHAEDLAAMKRVFQETWSKLPRVTPYGGSKLKSGAKANGPTGPAKAKG